MTSRVIAVVIVSFLVCVPAWSSAQGLAADDAEHLALLGLARTARERGTATEAYTHFRDADRRRPLVSGSLSEYFWAAYRVAPAAARGIGGRVISANPLEHAVRDGVIGLAVSAGDETAVRTLAAAGETADPGSAVWPRRLAESYLRAGDGMRAAERYAVAARRTGGGPADLAQRALALERSSGLASAAEAWNALDEAIVSSRPEWLASRTRVRTAMAPRPVPAVAPRAPVARPKRASRTADEVVRASQRALAAKPCAADPLADLEALASLDPFLAAVAARRASCPDQISWTVRAAERAIGLGRFGDALRLVETPATAPGASVEVREQHGVLLLWTGAPARAADVLRGVVADDSNRHRAADALIDALRAVGEPDAAWTLAAGRWSDHQASADRRLAVASLALETGRVTDALVRARALESDPVVGADARAIVAGALIASGRPDEARAALGHLRNAPGAALAWLDATALIDGVGAALRAADGLSERRGAGWEELEARLALWHAQMGHRGESDQRLSLLATSHPSRAALARAEIALATGRPADAVALLQPLVAQAPGHLRAHDVLSTSLAELGQWDEAFARLAALRAARPDDARWAIRDAEWQHRRSPSPATLAAVEAAASAAPELGEGRSALARTYLRAGDPARAAATLGPNPLADHDAILAARALRATGQPDRALAALNGRVDGSVELRLLRAALAGATASRAAVDAEFGELTSREDADPAWFLAWADAVNDAVYARRVLERGVGRFPLEALLHERLAVTAWAARDVAAARRSAERAISLDDRRLGAWFVQVELAARHTEAAGVLPVLDRFGARFKDSPSALLDMGNMLAGLARGPGDAAASTALTWATQLLASQPTLIAAAITRARLLAALGDLPRAVSEAGALARQRPGAASAHKLEAELLAAQGRYGEALAAYDRYLAVEPGDIGARRQQARIEGWRGHVEASTRRYAQLSAEHPTMAAIVAESSAKREVQAGHWHEALAAYDRWLALEPEDVEAGLERAQTLDRLGRTAEAVEAWRTVTVRVPASRVARDAVSRADRRGQMSLDLFTSAVSADGTARRQLLDLVDGGVALSRGFGGYGRLRLRAFGGPSAGRAPGREWRGGHAGADIGLAIRPSVDLTSSLTARALDGVETQWFGQAAATWRMSDEVRVMAGAERALVLDNAFSLESGLAASGVLVGARWQPSTGGSVDVSARRLTMSDGNARTQLRVDASRRLWHRVHELRLVGASEYLAHDETTTQYFAPASFWRHDLGLEGRRWLATPRFFGDRERWVSAAYLYGGDNRGVRYHTARVGAAYEFGRGAGVVANALIVRSRAYDGGQVSAGLRFRHVPTPSR